DGCELWKSDGTAAGTVMIKDLYPGTTTTSGKSCGYDGGHCHTYKVTTINSSNPSSLTSVNGTLFFVANDGTDGNELWKSDGTASGTIMVRDINAKRKSSSNPSRLANVNGVVFFSADDGSHGRELWKSDGTSAGTVLFADINPGSGSSDPASFAL